MNDLLENLEKPLGILRDRYGDFILFAVFMVEGSDRWDLMVAAPWLENIRSNYDLINRAVRRHLSESEMALIDRIVILDPEDDSLRRFVTAVGTDRTSFAVTHFDFGSASISRAHIFDIHRMASVSAKRKSNVSTAHR
jgi:hypothetical protein